MSQKEDLKGLSGWLILVGIGVVLSPIRFVTMYYPFFIRILNDGTWEILTTPGKEAYHPLWAPLLASEMFYISAMVLVSLYLVYLYFSKHYLFPKVYIAIVAASLIFIPLDAGFLTLVLPDRPLFDPASAKEFARALVSGMIWVPYMLISKRVRATFVKKSPKKEKRLDGTN